MKNIYVIPKARIIEAIDRLIAHYEGRGTVGLHCPLCGIGQAKGVGCVTSHECPWYWFAGHGCTRGVDVIYLRLLRPAWWCEKRLPELREWRRRIIAGEWGRKAKI